MSTVITTRVGFRIALILAFFIFTMTSCKGESTVQFQTEIPRTISPIPASTISTKPTTISSTRLPGLMPTVKTLASVQVSAVGPQYGNFPGFHPMDWSPDGKTFTYTLHDKVRTLRMFDFTDSGLVTIPKSELSTVYYSPNGEYLALLGMQPDEKLGLDANIIWSVKTDGTNLRDLVKPLQLTSIAKNINEWLTNEEFASTIWGGNGIQWLYAIETSSGESRVLISDRIGCGWVGGEYHFSPNRAYLVHV